MRTEEYQRLEREYGKYLFMPMDVPTIKPYDPVRFKAWFLDRAKPIYKNYADIASPDQKERYVTPSFLSVDSVEAQNAPTNWDINPVSDLFMEFPEIRDGVKALPFDDLQVYCLWSSQYEVSPHRDAHPLVDFPFAFRIKLYDENPIETLTLHKGLPLLPFAKLDKHRLPRRGDTNTFAWNNLRLLHSSVKMKGYMKVLMLIAPSVKNKPNLQRLDDLFRRSAAKFPEHVWIDNEPLASYLPEGHPAL
jgi:hypothetical protein